MELSTGDIVERYQVEDQIGQGGMAVVYRVRHTTLDTPHALKLLTHSNPKIRARLIREGKVQAGLKHPNVVTVTDVLDLEGAPALLMELIDGPDLDTWLREHSPDTELAIQIFDGILRGVIQAHSLGIIHRDLKPSNILMAIDDQGNWVPKVTDFGLAKAFEMDSDVSTTRTGRPMGTPAYMSPEQVRDAKNVDQRTDVFALGCILYELLCGQRTFTGTDTLEVFNRVVAGQFTPPRILNEELSQAHQQAIMGCLATSWEQRIPGCEVLRQVLHGEKPWEIEPMAADTIGFSHSDTLDFEASAPASALHSPGPGPERPTRSSLWAWRAPITGLIVIVVLWIGLPEPDHPAHPDGPEPQVHSRPSGDDPVPDAPPAEAPPETRPELPIDASTEEPPVEPEDAEPEDVEPDDVEPDVVPIEPVNEAKTETKAETKAEVSEAPTTATTPRPSASIATGYRVTGDARMVRISARFSSDLPPGPVPPGHYMIEASFGEEEPQAMGYFDIEEGEFYVIHCDSSGPQCDEVRQ